MRGCVKACRVWLPILWLNMVAVLPASIGAPTDLPVQDTFHTLLQRGVRVFSSGDYEGAVKHFRALQDTFGEEPEYAEASIQQLLLPLRGYANLQTGLPGVAEADFMEFLERFSGEARQRAFVLFNLGRALRENDKPGEASDIYGQFAQEFPGKPETALAVMRRADLLLQLGETDSGLALLRDLYNSKVSYLLRVQARLRALQAAIDTDRTDAAMEILLQSPWNLDTMPELAALAFAALRLGDLVVGLEEYGEAVRCYRLVPPKVILVNMQERRLNEIRAAAKRHEALAVDSSGALWVDYYGQLTAGIETRLEALQAAGDYTPGFLLRYGQALLLAGREREAWIVFESLALDEGVPIVERTEAHYRWILAAHALEYWDDALRIARDFIDRYPDSALAPQALFLIAKAYQEKRDYPKAIELLTELLDRFPEYDMVSRWIFTRGFCSLLDERHPEARIDLGIYLYRFPDGMLRVNAQLWHALSWFFEKKYDIALLELTDLAIVAQNHPLLPEIEYRVAATHYAGRNYNKALKQIDDWLVLYSGHEREPEALVLKGDILMGRGELRVAAEAFARVTPDARRLFPYAIFQTGKIYRALEDYENMSAHFQYYVEREDIADKPRVSEALYWIGWTYNQMGFPEKALPVFTDALATYGNRPEANEIQLILTTLHQLHNKLRRKSSGGLSDISLSQKSDFETWARTERQTALDAGELTYYARLTTFLAGLQERRNHTDEADTLLLEMVEKVPPTELGPEGLSRAGEVLEKFGFPSARDYYEQLVEEFPSAPQRAYAYYGLARMEIAHGQFSEARPLLNKLIDEMPSHPLGTEGALLYGQTLIALDDADEAVRVYEELLRRRSARGRPHAEALRGLALAHRALDHPAKAIAYYQRLYTLYRAYPDLVADAYLQSARLFDQTGDPGAAYQSLRELLDAPELSLYEATAIARTEIERLAPPSSANELPKP